MEPHHTEHAIYAITTHSHSAYLCSVAVRQISCAAIIKHFKACCYLKKIVERIIHVYEFSMKASRRLRLGSGEAMAKLIQGV